MSYDRGAVGWPDQVVSSTINEDSSNSGCWGGVVAASAVWPTANKAFFYPVQVTRPRTYVKAWWLNGATAAGNVDVGIYTISGTTATRVVASTAQAQAGASVMQVATTFTTTTIGPGLYYFAMSCSLATATVWKLSLNATVSRPFGCFEAVTSHPLPATATVTVFTASHIPAFGFSELSTV